MLRFLPKKWKAGIQGSSRLNRFLLDHNNEHQNLSWEDGVYIVAGLSGTFVVLLPALCDKSSSIPRIFFYSYIGLIPIFILCEWIRSRVTVHRFEQNHQDGNFELTLFDKISPGAIEFRSLLSRIWVGTFCLSCIGSSISADLNHGLKAEYLYLDGFLLVALFFLDPIIILMEHLSMCRR